MDSPDRADFLKNLDSGGKYVGIVGVYRHNTSAHKIGTFDSEIISALAETGVKWIAHNGAGYDQIDISACISKSELTVIFTLSIVNVCSRY
jgi:glyoxylate reductase